MSEAGSSELHQDTTAALRPATANGPIPRPTGPIRTSSPAGELLREMRDDERWEPSE